MSPAAPGLKQAASGCSAAVRVAATYVNMGNRASSPSRESERTSRGGSNASPTGRQQRNGERAARNNVPVTAAVDADEAIQPADTSSSRSQQQQQQEMSWYQMAKVRLFLRVFGVHPSVHHCVFETCSQLTNL